MACEVRRLETGKDDEEIKRLADLADEQQKELSVVKPLGGPAEATRSKPLIFPFDSMIQPWSSKFGIVADWHFVAQSPKDKRICGWLSAQLKETPKKDRKYIYISEISTRRIKDDIYGGVGKQLNDALVNAAKEAKYDFIYLYPVNQNPTIAKIYVGWGYSPPAPPIPHQFYIINRGPTKALKDSLIPQSKTPEAMHHARELAKGKFDQYRRMILADPKKVEELKDMLLDFEIEDANAAQPVERLRRKAQVEAIDSAEEARLKKRHDRMSEFLDSLPGEGGRRKTRRHRRLRKTHRRHK